VTVPVREDSFYMLGEAGQMRIPNWVMPPLMSNHGNYIVSMGNVCRWLAEQAEALGVEVFPACPARKSSGARTAAVRGVVAGEFGRTPTARRARPTSRGWSCSASTSSWARACAGRCRSR
jgi:electron-transferring-flavoprotein dehydrogenase